MAQRKKIKIMSSKDCIESQRLNNTNATKTRGYGPMFKKVKKSLKKRRDNKTACKSTDMKRNRTKGQTTIYKT